MAKDSYKPARKPKRIFWKVVTKIAQEASQEEVYGSYEPGDSELKLYRIGETTLQEKEGAWIMVLFPYKAARAFASDRTVCILKGWTQTLREGKDQGPDHSFPRTIGGVQFCRSFHPGTKVYDHSEPVRRLTLQDIADIWKVRQEDIPGTDLQKAELLDIATKLLEESGEEYFYTTLGTIDGWRTYCEGNIPC